MSTLLLDTGPPSAIEIGAMGYGRLLQHHYWEFLINYSKPDNEIFRKLITRGELAIREECALALKLACDYAESFSEDKKTELAFSTYAQTIFDAAEKIKHFENLLFPLLYGSEIEWLKIAYPDEKAHNLLEAAIEAFDQHLEHDEPAMMGETLELHKLYRAYLKSLDAAYGAKRRGREQGFTVLKSIELLDKAADELFILAASSGQAWVK